MKFNLKNLVLLLSIITSTNNNCINAMEREDINQNSNVFNVKTNDNIISETSINDSLNKYLRIILNGNNINIHPIQKHNTFIEKFKSIDNWFDGFCSTISPKSQVIQVLAMAAEVTKKSN